MNREMQELKADMREMREMNREIREMIREMNRELKADMREMNREVREMQELKADIRVMKELMQRLSRSASADWNINASSLDHQFKKSEEVEFQLLFANKLPDKIFTRDKIKDESDGSIQIKLIDTISRETVELDPLSSMEIEIVVLDGDFGYEGNGNWTEQEFNAKIVQQRKTKGPLVKGKQNITLRKGVGIIDDLSFSDNSSWKDCGKFRLGARVLQSRSMDQARIKEAISQAFVVNDFRMRVYHEKRSKKLDLPSLDNDVSPLKKIKKNAKCHTHNNIHTVKDFKEMHGTDLNKQIEILKDCSNSDREVTVQDASCVVDDEKLNASSNPILRQTTDPPLHYEFTAPYQGFAGMQNANNLASSSHDHKGGFSTPKEIVPNLASQPLDTSTGYPVNAQGVQSNSNGVLGRNSSQSNYNPLMAESSQINNGPHSHFPAEQHVFNAFDDTRPNAYSNPLISQEEAEAYDNRTTGSLPHEYAVPHQGFAGMQNANNHASSHDHKGGFSTPEEIVPNLASQPLDTSTGYPFNAQGVKSNSNFDPSSSQYINDELLQEIVQNDVYSDPEWNSSQLNEISNLPPSRNSYITTEDSQINKRQNTVMTDQFWNDLNLPNL